MEIIVIGRFICEMVLYHMVFGYAASLFNMRHEMYIPYAIFVVIGTVAWYLRKKKWFIRYLPILALIPVIWIATDAPADLICLVPPALLLGINIATNRLDIDYDSYTKFFKRGLIFMIPFLLFAILMPGSVSVERLTYPCVIVFLAVSIVVIRALRQDEDVVKQWRFKLLNTGTIVIMCICGIVFSTKAATSAYMWVFVAMGTVVRYILIALRTVLAFVMMLFVGPDMAEEMLEANEHPVGEGGQIETSPSPSPTPEPLPPPTETAPLWVLIIIVGMLFAVVLAILVMARAEKRSKTVGYTSEDLGDDKRNFNIAAGIASLFRRTEPTEKIRKQYRRYIAIIRKSSVITEATHTTKDIACMATARGFDESINAEIRNMYIKARYSKASAVTSDDVKYMKKLVDTMSQRFNEREAEHKKVLNGSHAKASELSDGDE